VTAPQPQSSRVDGTLERADNLLDLERADEALTMIHAVLAENPENVSALCLAARAELALKRPGEAVRAASRAHGIDPHSDWPLRLIALAESRRGQHWAAEQAALQAVSLAPQVWQTHQVYAAVTADNAPDKALYAVGHAVALAPQEPEPHVLRAGILLRRSDLPGAEAEYREALRLDPQNSAATNGLGLVSLRGRKTLTAAGQFADALRQDPKLSVGTHNLDVAFINTLAVPMQRFLPVFFIMAWVIGRADGSVGRIASWVIAAALAGVIVFGVVRIVQQVRGRLWPYVRTMPRRDPMLTASAGCLLTSLVGLVVGLVLPDGVAKACVIAGAVVTWFAAGLLLRRRVKRLAD
jgi:tetratricopeptide (TPR) repeat protein